ncbi:hypothetical protein KEM52_002020, partial [Ascosphaera acerosa]
EETKLAAQFHALLAERGLDIIDDADIRGILRSDYANNDPVKATELLAVLADSIEGTIYDFSPHTKLLGAVNRQGVSCYIDSLLFAMFLRFDCFQAILYNTFPDDTRNNLVILLRLWTRKLQELIAEAGWADAAMLRQQDASELFTFLTGKLELPLLTLKVDLYHTGCDDANDDHKFVNERLLEIPIPPERPEGGVITLEDCLESYFNNHVEVKRYLERQNTVISKAQEAASASTTSLKTACMHVECVTSSSGSSSPDLTDSHSEKAPAPTSHAHSLHRRTTWNSIIQKRWISSDSLDGQTSSEDDKDDKTAASPSDTRPKERGRRMRHEVMMPALQVFSLIPWYADNLATDDAQTAIHFSQRRPILGMCLKRYDIRNGRPIRRNTYVDIPVEIGLPHFIKDDQIDESAPIFGKFKLVLQAAVCHRGKSTDSGHYISLVRCRTTVDSDAASPRVGTAQTPNPDVIDQNWLRFDDLAPERVTGVDIEKALREESPYLLFYQIMPIDSPPDHDFDERPPDYEGHSFVLNEKARLAEGLRDPSLDEPRHSISSEVFEISRRSSDINLLIRHAHEARSRDELRDVHDSDIAIIPESADSPDGSLTVNGSGVGAWPGAGTGSAAEPLREHSTVSVAISRPPSDSPSRPRSQPEPEPRRSSSFFRFSRSGQRGTSAAAGGGGSDGHALATESSPSLAPPKTKRRHHRFSSESHEVPELRGRSSSRYERSAQKETWKVKKERSRRRLMGPERECVLM